MRKEIVITMKISGSEMELMKIIWERGGEVTSAELVKELGNMWKPTTISTFLKRLSDKGILSIRRDGKTGYYSAAISEKAYKAEQTKEFVNEIHSGSMSSLLTALCDSKDIDKQKLNELKHWFEEL